MLPSPSSTPDAQLPDAEGHDELNDADAAQPGQENALDASTQQAAGADEAVSPSSDAPAGAGQPAGRPGNAAEPPHARAAVAYRYPEWDVNANAFHPDGTVVRVIPAQLGSLDWGDAVLRDHAVLVRQARQQFEALQSHRLRLPRREEGNELDLDACVLAAVDRRMGATPSDRVYLAVRAARRELAVLLLVDVSASTRDEVLDGQRVIDVERLASVVAAAAFDALGDEYAIAAFSSDGAMDVSVTMIKDFTESNTPIVRQRVAALSPDGKTRLGAAIRHASAHLQCSNAPHRLLLILSDGKPNDRDRYFLPYGVADSRRAVMDARAEGVHTFCITVDREAPSEYMADIFGTSGYLTVRRPTDLPSALLGAVRRLLAS